MTKRTLIHLMFSNGRIQFTELNVISANNENTGCMTAFLHLRLRAIADRSSSKEGAELNEKGHVAPPRFAPILDLGDVSISD